MVCYNFGMKKTIKIVSWNVNGIRACIKKGAFLDFIKKEDPDILCLQETKAAQGQAEIDLPQYEEYWNSAERKGYSGTAIFTKQKPLSVLLDMPDVSKDALADGFGDTLQEGRVLTLEFEDYFFVTVYTPNSKQDLARKTFRQKKWDPTFLNFVKHLEKKKPVIFCGDLNVAHKEIDLARPKDNTKNAGFTPEEREGMDKIVQSGFIDTFRHLHPNQAEAYSWWSHFAHARERNIGWRIDYVFASKVLANKINEAFICSDVLGSDHAPVGIVFEK